MIRPAVSTYLFPSGPIESFTSAWNVALNVVMAPQFTTLLAFVTDTVNTFSRGYITADLGDNWATSLQMS